jgi:anti-sigma factor RsiW
MHDHDCGQIFSMLSEYLDRELPPATCEEFEEHIKDCPECVQFLESLKRSMKICRQFGDSQPLPAIDEGQMSRLRQAYASMLARRGNSKSES